MTTLTPPDSPPATAPASPPVPSASAERSASVTFGSVLRAEWIKTISVRSTGWTLLALLVLGAGLSGLVSWTSAEWLASAEADEAVGSFVTWGMIIAPVAAVVLGALAVTTEYGTGTIRAAVTAVPHRRLILLAKAVVLSTILFVAGTVTAFAGYGLAKLGLSTEGITVSLSDEGYLRAMFGSGLYLAAIGLLTLAVGFIVRHTAAAISLVLAVVFVLGGMALMLPGDWGVRVMRMIPGNAGEALAVPVPFNPNLFGPWEGYGVLLAEVALLFAVAWLLFTRRDA